MDLVHGLHLDLFSSHTEEAEARADWQAAKNAGADVEDAQFFSKEETHMVMTQIKSISSLNACIADVWSCIAVGPILRSQPLASQSCDPYLSASTEHVHLFIVLFVF